MVALDTVGHSEINTDTPSTPPGGRLQARAERRRARSRARRIVAAIGTSVLVVLMLGVGWAVFTYWSVSERIKASGEEAEAVAAVLTVRETKRAPDEPTWILLLGTDARPGEEAARSDTIILARLDTSTRQVTMLSIPRDTRVSIPGRGVNKINAATAYGGNALMIRTVQELTGLPVDHYVQIDFEGFRRAVDAMGGIHLDIERPINDLKAANYDRAAARIDAGPQKLDGAKALTFVRSRAYADGDYSRIRNQQRFITEFAKQALNSANIARLPAVANSIADHLDTDLSIRELVDLAGMLNAMGADGMVGYTVPSTTGTIGGVSYVLPDEVALRSLVDAILAGEQPDIASGQDAVIDFSLAVVNATTIDGAARRLGGRLEEMGFRVTRLSNDVNAAGGRSVVLYRRADFSEEAQLVAHALGDWRVEQDTSSATSRLADVVVVVGPARVGAQHRIPEF